MHNIGIKKMQISDNSLMTAFHVWHANNLGATKKITDFILKPSISNQINNLWK